MATTMASARQPFAPLNGARLQDLTNLKNRQNALSHTLSSPTKRKAASFDDDNTENIDPVIFLSPKRSKCPDGSGSSSSSSSSSSSKDTTDAIPVKPLDYFLTPAPATASPIDSQSQSLSLRAQSSPRRPLRAARSPAPRLDTSKLSRSVPLSTSTPAGRSPTRKRVGILNRRRGASSYTRVDPPKFLGASASSALGGFNIDSALSGIVPASKQRPVAAAAAVPRPATLHAPAPKDSWFFDIHQDTEEELATNLMEHSTCTLDISSDEESAARERDLRGKENVPPMDDVSQTRTHLRAAASSEGEMLHVEARMRAERRKREDDEAKIEVDRAPLGTLAAEDFYAEGFDASSAFLIHETDGSEELPEIEAADPSFDFMVETKGKGKEVASMTLVDELMRKDALDAAPKAKVLEPIEKAEDAFDVWESGSAKGDE